MIHVAEMNIDVVSLYYNTSPFLNSCFWSESLPELYYCFSERVSQPRKAFPKVVSQGQYLKGLMHSQNPALKFLRGKDRHCHSHPVTQDGICSKYYLLLKWKLFSQDLYNSAAESIIKPGKELASGEGKGQQHPKTSDIPLIDKWDWDQNCPVFSWVPHPSLPHCHWFPSPAPWLHALPDNSQLLCSQSWLCPFNWFSDGF